MRSDDEVGLDDIVASFRGEVYGDSPAMTAAWFRDHVARNDIDLARSPRWTVGGELSGAALLAFRGDRAWVGAFGVVPAFRGRGLARRYLEESLAIARAAGATTIELEVLENNPGAIRLYERGGFARIGDLIVWSRAPLAGWKRPRGDAPAEARDAVSVAAIAGSATCWQREPASVARAGPSSAVVIGGGEGAGAYAFVRVEGKRATVLDAGAPDAASARALLAQLDARWPSQTLILVNEPPSGPLHEALVTDERWREFARQRKMLAILR
ncbi:MAG: Acetyltransferase, gnat family protein [Candidatus Eremiobacteraeota bacterium]|nr:Acetyltransferase, gnat family protein [Candidatus Eremiobacteraeota bacterium]